MAKYSLLSESSVQIDDTVWATLRRFKWFIVKLEVTQPVFTCSNLKVETSE